MRGRQRSRTIASLVAEAKALEAQGVSELVLISQDTTRYGEDLGLKRNGLAHLVERLLAETAFPWIRFLYAYPKTLDESILELLAGHRLLAYVDIRSSTCRARSCRAAARGDGSRRCSSGYAIVPDIAIRDVHRGLSGEGRRSSGILRVRPAAEFDNLGAFVFARARSGPGLGDPVAAEERSGGGNSSSPSSARSRAGRIAPCAAARSKRSSKAPARRQSTSWRAACVPRPPRSMAAS
jgi:ribosomal protein S12 methylthiotransferase